MIRGRAKTQTQVFVTPEPVPFSPALGPLGIDCLCLLSCHPAPPPAPTPTTLCTVNQNCIWWEELVVEKEKSEVSLVCPLTRQAAWSRVSELRGKRKPQSLLCAHLGSCVSLLPPFHSWEVSHRIQFPLPGRGIRCQPLEGEVSEGLWTPLETTAPVSPWQEDSV